MRPLTDNVLWRLSQDGQLAEARVRRGRDGLELRIVLAGEVILSRVFATGSETACREVADTVRDDYALDGWRQVA